MIVDQDADIIARAVALVLDGRDIEARQELATLPHADSFPLPPTDESVLLHRIESKVGPKPNNAQRARIYERDGWRCRYCLRKLVVPPVLRLLRVIFPEFRGVRPGQHMPANDTEPAVGRVYPNVDHIHPVSLGGGHDDSNLATACTTHNENKGDKSGWIPRPALRDDWHGLTESLVALAERAGDDGDKDWFHALQIKRPQK